MYKKESRSWVKHLDFIVLDVLCMLLAFYLAYFVYVKEPLFADFYRRLSIVAVLLQIVICFFTEVYTGILRRGALKEFFSVVRQNLMLFVLLLIYLYLTKQSYWVSRVMIALFLVMTVLFSYIGRLILKNRILNKLKNIESAKSILIIGLKDNIIPCLQEFNKNPMVDCIIDGLVIMDEDCLGETIEGIPVVANAENVYEYTAEHIIDEVFINGSDDETLEKMSEIFLEMGITVHYNLIRIKRIMPNRIIERYGNFVVLTTCMRVAGPRQMFLKKAMDIAGALVGLLLTGIAFVIFAPIIKIQSPGPVFYKQQRVGKNGRIFDMYKFRTMCVDADQKKEELEQQNEMDGLMFKMKNDPRIFSIGRFMRKYSIDELPQFWNVLRGEMSLVGTRPPTVEEYEKYALHHRARLSSKPGITGLWQVSGRNNITDFEEVVRLDVQYINEWTIGLDIKLLLMTLKAVFMGDGAC
jgi:exopolysaccharide biosynthesis polyprenyl glycosylphosphotransferase